MIRVVRVTGPSMAPTLHDGDFVVVRSAPPRVGDVVVVAHPRLGRVVKRVVERDAAGRIAIAGDGPLSTSREDLGWIAPRDVVGRVVFQIRRR